MILSIIIPVYNVELYLAECLDSVFKQLVDGCEVIAVNDGSTDNSRTILVQYQNQYPCLKIITRENGGLSAARNSGLQISKGKYILFLDSDDYILPGALKRILDLIEERQLDIIAFNAKNSDGELYFAGNISVDKTMTGVEYLTSLDRVSFSLPATPVWLNVYKRDFLESNGILFYEGVIHEDNHFLLKTLFHAKKIYLYNFPVVYHRLGRIGSIMNSGSIKSINSLLHIVRDLYSYFIANNNQYDILYKKLFYIYINVAARILNLNLNRKIFTRHDAIIMKKGLVDDSWVVHYYLLKHNLFRIYAMYISSNHLILKKNIRRLIKVYWKIIRKIGM